MEEKKKRLIIIDGNAIVHRAYHALPPLTSENGKLVNAVYGFLLFFIKSLKEFQPDYIAAAFDFPAPTFRHIEYKEYKATRVKAPDDLYAQIPMVKEILKDFGIQVFEKQGFEADDIIGTISKLAPKKIGTDIETIILSGDLDVLQLVDKNTKVYAIRKGLKDTILYDSSKVKERFGSLSPEQLSDYKALRGDPSDNIPGVFGIGEKTAINLLAEFKTFENLYSQVEKKSAKAKKISPAIREKLLKYKKQAIISKMLGEINTKVPEIFDLEKCAWNEQTFDKEKAKEALLSYGFQSLVKRFLEGGEEAQEVQKPKIQKLKKQENPNQLKII